jgi:hypothetical protein
LPRQEEVRRGLEGGIVMRWFRIRIASLLGLVLFVAVAIAALRASDDAWDSGVFGATVVSLLLAVLLSIHRDGRRRAHWLGFALFGWAYVVGCLVPGVAERLPTSKGLAFLESKRFASPYFRLIVGNGMRMRLNVARNTPYADAVRAVDTTIQAVSADGTPEGIVLGDLDNSGEPDVFLSRSRWLGSVLGSTTGTGEAFVRIGHSLLAIVLAYLGGRLSAWMWGRRRQVPTVHI